MIVYDRIDIKCNKNPGIVSELFDALQHASIVYIEVNYYIQDCQRSNV